MIQVVINGKEAEINNDATVKDLLLDRKINPDIVVMEVNRDIISKNKYKDVRLQPGDQIEIVHFVGGG